MTSTTDTIVLIYFDDSVNEVYMHTSMPNSILRGDAVYIAENGMMYKIAYYNDMYKVAFAVRDDGSKIWTLRA